ncbi:MAG: hypothetical protein Q9192_009008, partial [Flavoplaca navasiana]
MPKLGDASNQLWEPQPDPVHAGRVSAKSIASASSPPVPYEAEESSKPQFLQSCAQSTASAPQDPPHPISSTQRRNSKHMKSNANITGSLASAKPTNRHQSRAAIEQLEYTVEASSDDSDIVDDDEDEDEDNDYTDPDIMDKNGTDTRSLASDEPAQDDYHDKSLFNSTPTPTSRPTRRITITLRDRRA